MLAESAPRLPADQDPMRRPHPPAVRQGGCGPEEDSSSDALKWELSSATPKCMFILSETRRAVLPAMECLRSLGSCSELCGAVPVTSDDPASSSTRPPARSHFCRRAAAVIVSHFQGCGGSRRQAACVPERVPPQRAQPVCGANSSS